MAGNERNEKDTSKRNSFIASTNSSSLLSKQKLNKSFNLSTTVSSTNGTRVLRKLIPVDPDKLRQFGLDLQIKKAVSQSIANSSSLLRGQELNKSFDPSTTPISNESTANRKMITLDSDKLRQFGLDLKVKKALPQSQNIGATVNKVFKPANRTVKLVQKVKLTSALSPKRAEKIPETSINLNLLQQQISDKLKMNNSFPSSVANQNIKSTQTIKMSPITNIKMTKIIPKEESYEDRAIHDADNNYRGWPNDKKDPKDNTVWINNTNLDRPSLLTTAKRLSYTIKSNSTSTPRRNNDIRTLDVVTVKNGTVINSRVSNISEEISHRIAPKQVELSKMVKTTGNIKNLCTFQGTIVDKTRPPVVTYDINSISTSNGASITDNISPKPTRVAHTPKSPVRLNYSTYVKPQEQRDSTVEFTKIRSKSLGDRKPQKIWSRFKKKNKMLQMENQKLKNRMYSLMENMNSINSINPFEVMRGARRSLPVETYYRVQPTSIGQEAFKFRFGGKFTITSYLLRIQSD